MTEPKYDEDLVNLGYLKKAISDVQEDILPDNVSRHYGSQPVPPYYQGDTWIDGNIVYTCINTRQIGSFVATDWVTESGATQKAESKNKVYLTQPSNYQVGDMWILQTDNDHRSGKKGDMLISTAGRTTYDSDDWVNMLGYGSIRSINETLEKINDVIDDLGLSKQSGVVQIAYTNVVPTLENGDLWYVTEDIGNYTKGELYKYDGNDFIEITDEVAIKTIAEASESNITEDGKIQIFYETLSDVTTMARGDICNDNGTAYRYNGTNWVEIYETEVTDIIFLDDITERASKIETDLGSINLTVSETTTTVANNYNELKTKFDDYAPKSDIITLQTSVEQVITDTYTKVEVDTKLTDGSVTKVSTTAGTFDSNGLTIEKTDAKTKGNFNESGITVMDATSGTDQELLFAGYDDTLNETIVRTKNITVERYITLKDVVRQEKYINPVLGGKGVGTFIL